MYRDKKKILVASILGNELEFYDFTLYGFFTCIIANRYFPGVSDTARILASLAAFGAGFLTRPFGGMVFGYIGDRYGRKVALSSSVLLMGVPTMIIGLLPGYEKIGLLASVIIFLCRLLQGLCTGGEYNGAAIFSIEHIGKRMPGFIGGCIAGSCAIGAFCASFLGSLSQKPGMPEWSWRVPFLIGGLISLFGYFMRRKLTETPEFMKLLERKRPKASLFSTFVNQPGACVMTVTLGSFNGALSYTLVSFMTIYLSKYLQIPLVKALQFNLVGLIGFMIGSPLLGAIFDRLGAKVFYRGFSFAVFVLAIPAFMAINSLNGGLILLGELFIGIAAGGIAGSGHAFMQSLFPAKDRYLGISFNFSVGMALLGSLTPIIYIQMFEKYQMSLLFPAYFLMAFAALFIAVLTGLYASKRDRLQSLFEVRE